MKSTWISAAIVNAVSIFALILYTAVAIPSFSMWFYRWQYRANDTYATVKMEPEHLHEVTRHMIRYMRGQEDSLQIRTIVNGQERYFFSELEIRHMEDVVALYRGARITAWICFILLIATTAAFIIWGRKRLCLLFKSWKWFAIGVTGGLLILTILVSINWHFAFDVFHWIFFNNDYWILDRRVDLMLSIMPYEFFIRISIFIASFVTLGLIAMFAAGHFTSKQARPTAEI